jgi:hypothetical protein
MRCLPVPAIALIVVLSSAAPGFQAAPDEFIVVPLRIHVLRSGTLSDIDCRLSDDDVWRVLRKVNGVWHRAGVHWGMETLRREPPAREAEFLRQRSAIKPGNLGPLLGLAAPEGRFAAGVDLYYIHEMPVPGENGVWLNPDGPAFVAETAVVRPIPGGIDEAVARVTAHELGHCLGLKHRPDITNLLARGTSGTFLTPDDIAVARTTALRLRRGLPASKLRTAARAAESKNDRTQAALYWRWLSSIPDEGRAEARARLERLTPKAEQRIPARVAP